MTNTLRRGAAAVVLACLASAHPALAADREPVQAHVSRVGLDLSTPAGQAILVSRIRAAARKTCISYRQDFTKTADERRCRDEMMRDGTTQLAAIVGTRNVEIASLRP